MYLKTLISIAAVVASLAPASAQQFSNNAAFHKMLAETGCTSKYNDDKKADLFELNYNKKQMTVTGQVASLSGSKVGLKVLSHTLTTDIDVKLRDRQAAYNLEKGQRVTVAFTVSFHGGCFLPYSGEDGVLASSTS